MQQLRVTFEQYVGRVGYGDHDANNPAAERVLRAARSLIDKVDRGWWVCEMLSFALHHGAEVPISVPARFVHLRGHGLFLLPFRSAEPGGRNHVQAVVELDSTFVDRNPNAPEAFSAYPDVDDGVGVYQVIALGTGSGDHVLGADLGDEEVRTALARLET